MRLALAGQLFSGKSTLAKALAEHGFTYVNYTDYLKKLASKAIYASLGQQVSIADMHADKERYRPFIIALGTLAGFDQGAYVEQVLDDAAEQAGLGFILDEGPEPIWQADGYPKDIVWDCIRFPAQYDKLVPFGFRLVRCELTPMERIKRARAAGLELSALERRLEDPTEAELPHYPGEVTVTVDGPIEDVLNDLTAKVLSAELAERQAGSALAM